MGFFLSIGLCCRWQWRCVPGRPVSCMRAGWGVPFRSRIRSQRSVRVQTVLSTTGRRPSAQRASASPPHTDLYIEGWSHSLLFTHVYMQRHVQQECKNIHTHINIHKHPGSMHKYHTRLLAHQVTSVPQRHFLYWATLLIGKIKSSSRIWFIWKV